MTAAGPRRSDVIDARRRAAQEWSTALGDATSCALARDGRSHPAAKFHEGQVAALGELSRKVTDGTDPARIGTVAATIRARWADQVMPGGGEDRDWESYRSGGLQALAGYTAAQGSAA